MENTILVEAMKLVGAVGAVALVGLLVQVLRRMGVDINAAKRAQIEQVVADAIVRTEEWAAQKKLGSGGVRVPGGVKLATTIKDVLNRIPGIDDEEAAALVHSTLAKLGIGAAVKLAELRKAVQGNAPVAAAKPSINLEKQ